MTGPPPRRDSVLALLVAVFCASAASLAASTALGKQMYDLTGRPLDLGLLGLVEFAPAALLVLVTGSVADRFDRRRVIVIASLGEAVVALLLALYAGAHGRSVLALLALVLLLGICRAFVAPAIRSLPADVVVASRLPWLVARTSGAWQVAIIFGPVLGGTLYAVNVALPYVAMAALLTIGAGAMVFVRVQPRVPRDARAERLLPESQLDETRGGSGGARGGLHQALLGLRYIRTQPVLLGAISLDLFAVLFGGAIALLPAIADQNLGVGAVGLGWLRAAGGIGAALVTLALSVNPLRRRVGSTLFAVVALFGLATIVLGLTHSFVLAFLAMAILSGADSISVFIRATLVPLVTPADRRGRVLAVENVFIGASNELGAFESGIAGQLLGAPGAVILGGVATLVVTATWWSLVPALRRMDRFPAPDAAPSPGSMEPDPSAEPRPS